MKSFLSHGLKSAVFMVPHMGKIPLLTNKGEVRQSQLYNYRQTTLLEAIWAMQIRRMTLPSGICNGAVRRNLLEAS